MKKHGPSCIRTISVNRNVLLVLTTNGISLCCLVFLYLCISDKCRIPENNHCATGAYIYVSVGPLHSQAAGTIPCQRWSCWRKAEEHIGTAGGTIFINKMKNHLFCKTGTYNLCSAVHHYQQVCDWPDI